MAENGMAFWGEGRLAVCAVLLLAYAMQAVQIILLPVPSSFSTVTLLTRRRREPSPGPAAFPACGLRLLALCAGAAMIGALLPLAVCLAPGLYPATLPLFVPGPGWQIAGSLLLIGGNALSLAAVLTLRKGATFDHSGETEILITSGVFRLIRHPVLAGLGLIYLGFFLLLPSAVLLAGLAFFFINARFRMHFEEAELLRRFGTRYALYAARVGRLVPRGLGPVTK
jgi:protein-S-isoprenylcysteine O-methyltransferase Ste14